MGASVSQREFAKHIGRSHVWVSKLVKSGKLPTDANGKIPLDEGLRAYESSQVVGYDANRAHAEKQRQQSGKAPAPKAGAKTANSIARKKTADVPTLPDDDDIPFTSSGVTTAKLAEAFNRARTAEKTYQAKLKEMEWKKSQGELISRDEVIADAASTAEELRGMLFAIPQRVSPLCEGKAAREIEVLIEDAINDALTALQKSRYAKGAATK